MDTPFNVLILPLLGGYLFLTNWNYTRFNTRRHSGERLIFHSAAAGAFCLLAAFIVVTLIVSIWHDAYPAWKRLVPFAYSGTAVGAFLIGATGWIPLNLLFPREREASRVIREWGDHFEEMLEVAITETRQVSVTLKSGKVYVGFVTSNIDPGFDRKYVQLMPIWSGYRDASQEVVFTTDYSRVYQQMIEEAVAAAASERGQVSEGDHSGAREWLSKWMPSTILSRLRELLEETFRSNQPSKEKDDYFDATDIVSPEEFLLILPVAEITSANLFDHEVYVLFNTSTGEDIAQGELDLKDE